MITGKNREQFNAFTADDRQVARRAWDSYMYEINGTGFRWEFDRRPGQMDEFLSRDYFSPAAHFNEMDRFVDRVRSFGGFVTDLETFVGRPVTRPHPLAWGKPEYKVPDMLTRDVTQDQVDTYNRLYSSLVDYTGALVNHGPNSTEVAEAATAVAQNVRPDAWREAGAPIPEGTTSYSDYDTRWYLEDVMSVSQAQ
jgi:hypothetical protein